MIGRSGAMKATGATMGCVIGAGIGSADADTTFGATVGAGDVAGGKAVGDGAERFCASAAVLLATRVTATRAMNLAEVATVQRVSSNSLDLTSRIACGPKLRVAEGSPNIPTDELSPNIRWSRTPAGTTDLSRRTRTTTPAVVCKGWRISRRGCPVSKSQPQRSRHQCLMRDHFVPSKVTMAGSVLPNCRSGSPR
jgi:hypothetical protein